MNPCILLLLAAALAPASVQTEDLALVDATRARSVPVVVYSAPGGIAPKSRIAILSHGYGGKSTDYSFIATALAARGFLVASVQHEVPGDQPLPTTGKPAEVRRPSWQSGVANLRFAIRELKARYPAVDWGSLVLIGHSHGGDTAMLFATETPGEVSAVISLDSRRMPFPRVPRPRILSLRSSDQVADDGVLPTPEEQTKFGIRLVKLPATIHNDMWDGATDVQKSEMLAPILEFLNLAPRPTS
jgi:predicted dienelactone hydrolase